MYVVTITNKKTDHYFKLDCEKEGCMVSVTLNSNNYFRIHLIGELWLREGLKEFLQDGISTFDMDYDDSESTYLTSSNFIVDVKVKT